jgi:hypothetical protein
MDVILNTLTDLCLEPGKEMFPQFLAIFNCNGEGALK